MNDSARNELEKVLRKYDNINELPYLDKDNIKNVVNVFDKFVNQYDTNEMLAFAARLSMSGDDVEYLMEMMERNKITIPSSEDDVINVGLAAIGSGMTQTHRTLQQNFMRVIIAFIEIQSIMYECGMYDARNEQTCKLCNIMWKAVKDRNDIYLPMI